METKFQKHNITDYYTDILPDSYIHDRFESLQEKVRCVASLKIVGTELNIQILAIEGDTVFDWYDINRDVTHIFHDLSLYSVKVIISVYGGA